MQHWYWWPEFFFAPPYCLICDFWSALFIFFIFLILLWRFYSISIWQSWLWILGLNFFKAELFSRGFLNLHLWSNEVWKTMIFGAMGVCILNHDTRPKICLSFCIACFLHHLFEVSLNVVLLFYFNFEGRFKVFQKIANNY